MKKIVNECTILSDVCFSGGIVCLRQVIIESVDSISRDEPDVQVIIESTDSISRDEPDSP